MHTRSARQTLKYDPLIWTTSRILIIGTQVRGLQGILEAAEGLEETGLIVSDISLALSTQPGRPQPVVRAGSRRVREAAERRHAAGQRPARRAAAHPRRHPERPHRPARRRFGRRWTKRSSKLHEAVIGYARADASCRACWATTAPSATCILPQNDTELFPSGGLISSYAIVTFDKGPMKDVQLEYFGTLYDRWQSSRPRNTSSRRRR